MTSLTGVPNKVSGQCICITCFPFEPLRGALHHGFSSCSVNKTLCLSSGDILFGNVFTLKGAEQHRDTIEIIETLTYKKSEQHDS